MDPGQSPQPAASSPRRRVLPLVVLAALLIPALIFAGRSWLGGNPDATRRSPPKARFPSEARVPPEDPRLTFPTPYRNVRPEVKYVGDAACAGCHPSQAKTYREHPMGRSLAPLAAARPLERYTEAARNAFEAASLHYRVERRGEGVWHQETVTGLRGDVLAETAAEVHFAVGSGRSGRAYLIDREGYLFTSPITWYPAKGIWDLSPGYEKRNLHFDRPITPDCLFCHSNYADHVVHTSNRYRPPIFRGFAIGCERCHGPGELHVERRRRDEEVADLDDTIVNPARLEHSLREAVCQQCHLQGQMRVWRRGRDTFDYRPGLPFHLFMSEFVKPSEEGGAVKFVGTVEQMYASRCFQKSAGKNQMGCISCHDPHAVPAEEKKAAFYRQRCLNCHQDQGCRLPPAARQEKADSCIACHMPKTGSNVNHTAITDHRIPRLPVPAPRQQDDDWPRPGRMPLVHFHHHLTDGKDPEVERDLGIALVTLTDLYPRGDVVRWLAETSLPLLDSALRRDDKDLPAWEAMGNALWCLGRLEETAAGYQKVLGEAPERENALFLAASLALRLRRGDAAREYAERAVRANPWRSKYHLTLANACAQGRDWRAALQACRKALELNAADPGARHSLVICHLRLGDRGQAQKEFDTLLALNPPNPGALRAWFAEQLRQVPR